MIKKLLLVLGILFSMVEGFSQSRTISVPFSAGFLGNYSTQGNKSTNSYSFAYLGLSNVRFTQSTTTGAFTAQGNDIPGNVVFVDAAGQTQTIHGIINWRAPSGAITTMCFLPDNGVNTVVATSINGVRGTYTIIGTQANPYSTIGMVFNGRNLSFTEGGEVTGNAATQGLLTTLNGYLAEFPVLTINNVSVTEGVGTTYATLMVTLTGTSTSTVTVEYTTADNTAASGTNYVSTSGMLTFPPSTTTTTQTISIPIVDNIQPDNGKTFYVNLFNPTNASINGTTGTVTINDPNGGNPLATTEQSSPIAFALKQNPVQNGAAEVEYHNVKDATLSIFDLTGKNIKIIKLSNSNGSSSIDVSGLEKGVYMLMLKSQNQVAVTKMMIH